MENTQPPVGTNGGTDRTAPNQVMGEPLDAGESLDQPFVMSAVQPAVVSDSTPASPSFFQSAWKKFAILTLCLLVLIGGITIVLRRGDMQSLSGLKADNFGSQSVPLSSLPSDETTPGSAAQTLKVNGQLEINDTLVVNPSLQPAAPVTGQIYYDQSTDQLAFYNGTQFLNLVSTTAATSILQNVTNVNNFFTNNSSTTNVTAGITTTGGTPNRLMKFTAAQTAGDSIVTDNTTFLEVGGGINIIAPTSIDNFSFWESAVTPNNPNFIDLGGPVELGMKFTSDVAGVVNGLRFYRGTSSVGPYTGSLWTSTGTLLAQATFSPSGTGWQTLTFGTPVTISPDTTYVASYHVAGGGGYATETGFFGSAGVDKGPIHALANGIDGANGIFRYNATPVFPNTPSGNSSNYWVDIDFSGATYTADSRIRINGTQISSNDLGNDSNLAKRGSSQVFSGRNIFRNANDSTSSFDIQKSDTSILFSADTLNAKVHIGNPNGESTGTLLVLSNRTSTGDPAGVEGAIYYNTAQKSFRCYRNGAWDNCAQPEVDRSFAVYEEFLGGQNTNLATDRFGSLNWHTQAIGAHGSVAFDPGSPTPAADRPGVLALTTPAVVNQGTTFLLSGTGTGSMLIARDNIVKTAVAVSSLNQVVRVGLHNQTTGSAQPSSGLWWEADMTTSPQWRYCYGDGTAATCTNSGINVVADAWVRLELRVTNTGTGTSSFSAGIDGTFNNLNSLTIDTTNRVSPALSCFTTTASANNCYWDYFQLKGTTAAPR